VNEHDEILARSLRWAAVGLMSARIGHESNNLLTGILGHAELALLKKNPAEMAAKLEAVVRSARELKVMTERFDGFSGMMQDTERGVNLVEVVKTMCALLERAFTKAGVQIEPRFGTIPSTWCNPGAVVPALLYCLRLPLDSLRAAGGGRLIVRSVQEGHDLVFRMEAVPHAGVTLQSAAGRRNDLTHEQAAAFAEQAGGSMRIDLGPELWCLECRFPLRSVPALRPDSQSAEPVAVSPVLSARE